jgi:hypothetical protein
MHCLFLRNEGFALATPALLADSIVLPKNYENAIAGPYAEQWEGACKKESGALERFRVFNSKTPCPTFRKPTKSRWVWKCKPGPNGFIKTWKARLVILGCLQRQYLDYNSTFAPTARSSTIRILLSVAGTYDLELRNYDIVSAFLGSKLKEDIWVMLLAWVRGFQKGQVVKLLASVYGLKQAARCWWKTLDEHLRGIGFRATVVDPCLYYRWIGDKYWLMALVVDNMILATNDTSGLLGKELSKRFEVKDMGDRAWCFGMQITRSRKEKYVFCSQEAYCNKILRDFTKHLEGRKPVSMPGDGNKRLSKDQCVLLDPGKATAFPLASAVGALLYLATQTRQISRTLWRSFQGT